MTNKNKSKVTLFPLGFEFTAFNISLWRAALTLRRFFYEVLTVLSSASFPFAPCHSPSAQYPPSSYEEFLSGFFALNILCDCGCVSCSLVSDVSTLSQHISTPLCCSPSVASNFSSALQHPLSFVLPAAHFHSRALTHSASAPPHPPSTFPSLQSHLYSSLPIPFLPPVSPLAFCAVWVTPST